MNIKIFILTFILLSSFISFELLLHLMEQKVDAFENYGIDFVAQLDPYQLVSDNKYTYYDRNSHGVVYLSFDPYVSELQYEVFLEGLSYEEGDDVEIIQIHLGKPGQDGPTVLSLCDEKKGKGHCREGPGLSVEGILKEKDLKGPLKGSSLHELIELIESGDSYVYVQSRDHPEGEIRGQIYR